MSAASRTIGVLAVMSLGAALVACGGGGSGSTGTGPAGPATAGATTGGSVTTADTSAAGSTPPGSAPDAPVRGGTLVWAIEADTSSPWRPYEMVCAASCYQTMSAVYDTLTVATRSEEGWAPYLAESMTPNADHTVWTIEVRPGVSFHDGTPLDGAAVVDNLERARTGLLTGVVLQDVTDIAVRPDDPLAVDVTLRRPWVPFPIYLSGQVGMIASPTWLAASDTDEALRAKPVGTGPFVFESYAPGESFRATRNADYWNAPFPYLDAVELRPIEGSSARRDALESGAVQIIHTTSGETVAEDADNPDVVVEDRNYKGPTNYTLLHVTEAAPDGDPSPLTDRRVRCALAYATDTATLIQSLYAGVPAQADGPFSPLQAGHLDDSGFPMAQDLDKAKELIADYKAERPGPLRISLATTPDENYLTIAQFQKQWWEEAGVDQVSIDQLDQGAFIVAALKGQFQAFQWRGQGGVDMDAQYIWWHSSSALAEGQLALNFGRLQDPVIDEALDANRASTDPAEKSTLAETVNRRFAEECYALWGWWTPWAIIHTPEVHVPATNPLPGGGETEPASEIVNLRGVWISP